LGYFCANRRDFVGTLIQLTVFVLP
jgi:hypothetical protein